MIELEYEGNVYRYCNGGEGRGYWIGIRGKRSAMYTGNYCSIPLGFHSTLRREAIKLGYSENHFSPKMKEPVKLKAKRVKAKTEENCIKIF